MNRKWKTAIIAAAVLLLAGTAAFAQAGGNSRRNDAPLTLGERADCGPRRGNGGCGGPGSGVPEDRGDYGGGFDCH